MNRKSLSLLIIIGMLVVLITGCTTTPTTTTTTTQTTAATTTAATTTAATTEEPAGYTLPLGDGTQTVSILSGECYHPTKSFSEILPIFQRYVETDYMKSSTK